MEKFRRLLSIQFYINGMTPRIVISIVLLVHGLIHLMGFLKAWGISNRQKL